MDCSTCRESQYCRLKSEMSRKKFFALASGTAVTCWDYAPAWHRGVEGVYRWT